MRVGRRIRRSSKNIGPIPARRVGGFKCTGDGQSFNGVDQYSYVADNEALDVAEVNQFYVLSGWIFTGNNVDGLQYCFGKNIAAADDNRFGVYVSSGTIGAIIDTGDPTTVAGQLIDTDAMYHVVQKIDTVNKQVELYVNGILKDSGNYTGDWGSLASGFYLGCGLSSGGATDKFFEGKLRDVRIYHKDVTPDIDKLMNGEALGDEVAWWCLSNGNFDDLSGNGYNLTSVNI